VEQAIATWGDALQYEPDNAEIKDLVAQHCLKRAAALAQSSDYDGAIRVLNTGLRHAPNHRGIKERLALELNRRGVSYANRKEWNLATADFEQAHQLAPGNQQIATNLEQVRGAQRMGPLLQIVEQIQAGRYDAAIAQLTTLIQREPRNSEARELLGYAYYQRGTAHNSHGNWGGAIADMEQALRYQPNNQRYLEELAVIRKGKALVLLQNNQSTDAIELLMTVLERDPRDAEAALMMAGACNLEGVRLANEAVLVEQYSRGNACQQLSDAEALLAIGLQYAPGNKMLIENRNRVNSLRRQVGC
jgi:tetratricopeptide (TPR) repeat protein